MSKTIHCHDYDILPATVETARKYCFVSNYLYFNKYSRTRAEKRKHGNKRKFEYLPYIH